MVSVNSTVMMMHLTNITFMSEQTFQDILLSMFQKFQ